MSGVADVQEEARGRLSRLRRATGALLASFNSLISLLRIGDSNMPFVEGARIAADTDAIIAGAEQLRALIGELRLDAYFLERADMEATGEE